MSKFYLKLTIREIDNEKAVEALFDELSQYPYIQSASISYGGVFGKTVSRDFYVEEMFKDVVPRVMVQHFEYDRLNRKEMREMIASLEGQARELKEHLKLLEYPRD